MLAEIKKFRQACRQLERLSSKCPTRLQGGIRDRRLQFCTSLSDRRPKMRLEADNVRNWR